MTRVWLVLCVGLLLSLLGTLTTTDAISLRAVFQNVVVLGPLVLATRNAMGTSLAHTLEPLCALVGLAVMLAAAGRCLPSLPARSALAVALRSQHAPRVAGTAAPLSTS
jgi:hypothetical protein